MKPLPILCLVALFLAASWVQAEEKPAMTLADLPEAVQKAFTASHPNLKVTGCDQEVEGDDTHFEIETQSDETQTDFVYLEDGTLLQTEQEIAVDALPDPVVAAIMKAHPKGELDEAEKITLGSAIRYEVAVEADEVEYELLLASDGKILSSVKMEDDERGEKAGDVDTSDQEDDD